jgi:hypothetical protein
MLIIDLAYLKGKNGELVVKEMAIIGVIHEDYKIFQSYMFLPPYPETDLSEETRIENEETREKVHSIAWDHGLIDYSLIITILKNAVNTHYFLTKGFDDLIFVKGNQNVVFLKELWGRTVSDLDAEGCPKADTLRLPRITTCMHGHIKTQCALHNCNKYAEWIRKLIRNQAYSDIQKWPHRSVFRPGRQAIKNELDIQADFVTDGGRPKQKLPFPVSRVVADGGGGGDGSGSE